MGSVEFTLHPLDTAIIVLYFVTTIAIGFYFSRIHESAEDYFLAGRSMLWPFIGLSLYASNMSSTSLVGLAGEAYSTGISVFNYEWMAAIILVFFSIFILPFILRSRVYTMPEFLERRFDRRARNYFSVLTLFLNIVVDTAGSLYAGALLLKLIFPSIPIWQSITVLAVAAGAYTIAGGLAAVIFTDAIQAILLTLGSILLTFFAYQEVGGWSAVTSAVPADMLSLIRPNDDAGVPWLGMITGVPLLGFYLWCTNQFMVQRVLSAKNEDHGRWGCLFAGLLKLPPLFIMVLPGTMAILLYPNLEKPDLIYPTMLFDLMPVGLLGLVLSGFVAALMSQIDSTLNSASTLVTMDFVREFRPDLGSNRLMQIGRIVTFLVMLFAVLWAPQIENFGSLFKYLQRILAYTVPPVVALYLVGIFWKRANASGAFAALVTGSSVGIALFFVNEVFEWTSLHFLYVAPILFILSVACLIGVSLVSPGRIPENVDDMVWSRAYFRAETETLKSRSIIYNYRIYAALLLAATAALVFAFW